MFNFAIIGCGAMAHWHAEELLRTGQVSITSLVDPTRVSAERFKEKFALQASIYESMEAMLSDAANRADAVAIVTPHTLHYALAKAAMEAGLHVLVEKPMVTATADAYDLWHTANRTGKLLGITFQSPYTARFGYLATARDAGQLGKIESVTGLISQNWRELCTNTWRQDPALSGGGFMYDTGAHLLNAIMWLMNEPVVEVGCFLDRQGLAIDITAAVLIRFQSGAVASLNFAGNTPTFESEIKLLTNTCTMRTDAYGRGLEIFGKDRQPIEAHLPWQASESPHANFIAALRGEQPLRVPPRYGVLLSALMDGIYESASSGQLVKVKPVPNQL